MPKYSVVISVYNKEGFIAETLQSVLTQTITDFEIIVLNDGSTDSSEMVIKPFLKDSRIQYFFQENQGAGAGRNTAISHANGEFIALLDADDRWLPNYLEEIDRLTNTFPNEHVFATNSIKLQNGKELLREFSVDLDNKTEIKVDFFKASFQDSIVNSSSVVLKKEVFEKIGLYNPAIKSGQDTDLFIRMGLQFPVVFSPKICTEIIVAERSLSKSTKVENKANFRAYESFENDNPGLKKYLDLNRYSLCLLAILEGNKEIYQQHYSKIDLGNLNRKQRFLLNQNSATLKVLFQTKKSLARLGLRLSAFK